MTGYTSGSKQFLRKMGLRGMGGLGHVGCLAGCGCAGCTSGLGRLNGLGDIPGNLPVTGDVILQSVVVPFTDLVHQHENIPIPDYSAGSNEPLPAVIGYDPPAAPLPDEPTRVPLLTDETSAGMPSTGKLVGLAALAAGIWYAWKNRILS